jgi:signal transduction histidine kinase
VFPLRGHNEVRGLICLGRMPGGFPLDTEVCDRLVQTGTRLWSAIEHAQVIHDRINLELNMLESEKWASLGRLSASIAHEVKNPLSSIKILAQLLQEETPRDHPRQDDLRLIIGETDRLARVVNQLLRFARPPRGETDVCEVSSVLDMVLPVVKPEADATGIEIEAEPAGHLSPVRMGEDSLKEVLFNLVYNCIQAMPGGGRLKIESAERDGDVEVRISDTGPGIPEEIRDKIFEPFFTTKVSGTGLGLSIVKRRVEEIGGTVAVSQAREGTTFTLVLPAKCEPDATAQEAAGPAAAERAAVDGGG